VLSSTDRKKRVKEIIYNNLDIFESIEGYLRQHAISVYKESKSYMKDSVLAKICADCDVTKNVIVNPLKEKTFKETCNSCATQNTIRHVNNPEPNDKEAIALGEYCLCAPLLDKIVKTNEEIFREMGLESILQARGISFDEFKSSLDHYALRNSINVVPEKFPKREGYLVIRNNILKIIQGLAKNGYIYAESCSSRIRRGEEKTHCVYEWCNFNYRNMKCPKRK
jgi:hypothetical protein